MFKLLSSFPLEFERMMARFWWTSKKEGRSIIWMNWDRLSDSKSRGEMGFKLFQEFSQAMLEKK